MYTSKLFESYNKELNESRKLTEKINKDNIEINKAIANPNAGKNREKINKAGYELSTDSNDKVYGVRNPKTDRFILPSEFPKDKKGKVDFKGMLDKPNSKIDRTKRYDTDIKDNKVPKSAKLNKGTYNNDEVEYYSPRYRDADKKSTSSNINDYKKAVTDAKDAKSLANSSRSSQEYYEKKVRDAQKDLDMNKDYTARKEKEADKAEAKRKEIIANARAKRKTESEELEEAYSERYGGDPKDFIGDVISIKAKLEELNLDGFGSHLAQQMVEEFIETCDSQISMTKGKIEAGDFKESEK